MDNLCNFIKTDCLFRVEFKPVTFWSPVSRWKIKKSEKKRVQSPWTCKFFIVFVIFLFGIFLFPNLNEFGDKKRNKKLFGLRVLSTHYTLFGVQTAGIRFAEQFPWINEKNPLAENEIQCKRELKIEMR